MSRIEPTVGRIVHFYDFNASGPYAAIITAVLAADLIRVHAFDVTDGIRGSNDVSMTVRLVQAGDVAPAGEAYACWMPYQTGQAAKAEALEKQVEARAALEPAVLQRIAPRSKVTPADLDAEIAAGTVAYTRIGRTTTHCMITLVNGFSVTGESACVDPANFDEQMGREIAFKNAREKLWPLLGFRLADRRAHPAYIVEQGALTEAQIEELVGQPMQVIARPAETVTLDVDMLSELAISRLLANGAVGVAEDYSLKLLGIEATLEQMRAIALPTKAN